MATWCSFWWAATSLNGLKEKALLALTGIWMAALAVFAFTDNYYLLLAGMFCAMGASTLLNTTLNLVTPLLFASSPAFL